MESEYLKSLDYEARKMYFAKLTNGGAAEKLPDPFSIAEDKSQLDSRTADDSIRRIIENSGSAIAVAFQSLIK